MGKGDFLDPAAFQAVTPSLGTSSTTTSPDRGDFLNTISLTAGDPDRSEGFTGFQLVSPTLSAGSIPAVTGHGDVGDVFGSSQNSDTEQGAYGFIAFQTITPTLGIGAIAAIAGRGDVADVGGPSELSGIPNDSGAGPGVLITWSNAAPTLGLGSVLSPKQHGDLGELYGLPEVSIQGLTWEQADPTLVTGTVLPITNGSGDVSSDSPSQGYGTNSQVWFNGLVNPVLSVVINGFAATISLTWVSIGTETPYAVYRSVNGGQFALYTFNVEGLSYTDTDVAATASYSYYVQSELPVLVSNIVNPYAGLVPPVLSYTVSGAQIHLSWTSIGIPTYYSIYRSVNGGAFALYQSGLNALSYSDASLIRGATYNYFVRSYFPQYDSNQTGVIVGTFVDTYLVSYTWAKRSGAYQIDGIAVGGGGGGGAGALQNSGTAGPGAGGGAGGYVSFINAAASLFTSTVVVTVGTGGTGAPDASVPAGASGGASSFGAYAIAGGGTGGGSNPESFTTTPGGSATCTVPGATTEVGGNGGPGILTDNGSHPQNAANTALAPSGGGGGGPSNNISQPVTGGTGGDSNFATGGAGGASAVGTPNTPVTASNGMDGNSGSALQGTGGGGGGSAIYVGSGNTGLVPAGNGGNGALSGGGGGGGGKAGGSLSTAGGEGGNGAQGIVKVTTYLW